MSPEAFVHWLEGFGAGAADDMEWWLAWQTISQKMVDITPTQQVSHGSDVVDTDNNWLAPNRPPGARSLTKEDDNG